MATAAWIVPYIINDLVTTIRVDKLDTILISSADYQVRENMFEATLCRMTLGQLNENDVLGSNILSSIWNMSQMNFLDIAISHGYGPVINAICKLCDESPRRTIDNLEQVIFYEKHWEFYHKLSEKISITGLFAHADAILEKLYKTAAEQNFSKFYDPIDVNNTMVNAAIDVYKPGNDRMKAFITDAIRYTDMMTNMMLRKLILSKQFDDVIVGLLPEYNEYISYRAYELAVCLCHEELAERIKPLLK